MTQVGEVALLPDENVVDKLEVVEGKGFGAIFKYGLLGSMAKKITNVVTLTNMRLVLRSSSVMGGRRTSKSFFLENLDSTETSTTSYPGLLVMAAIFIVMAFIAYGSAGYRDDELRFIGVFGGIIGVIFIILFFVLRYRAIFFRSQRIDIALMVKGLKLERTQEFVDKVERSKSDRVLFLANIYEDEHEEQVQE